MSEWVDDPRETLSPSTAQLRYIDALAKRLREPYPNPQPANMLEASELINDMKDRLHDD